jgi:hypothetical protein
MNIIDIDGSSFFYKPIALFEKARYDFERIDREKASKIKMIYALFDTIMTINHLFDWIMGGKNENAKERCVKMFNPFENITQVGNCYRKYFDKNNFPKTNNNQRIIRGISNNIKHYKVTIANLSMAKTNIAQAGLMCAGQAKAVAGYYELTLKVKDNQGDNTYDLISLLGITLKQWEGFIEQVSMEKS